MAEPTPVKNEEMHKTIADSGAAERFITEKRLGERIRRLRLKKSMGLVDLGKHTGLSASYLSQLETGRVVPTLRNLARIAMVFSKDLSYFFESEPVAMFSVHRKKDRVRMPQTGVEPPAYTFESLGYMVPDRHMDPYFAEFLPLPENVEPKAHIHAGFEFLYVLGASWRYGTAMSKPCWPWVTPPISTRTCRTPTVAWEGNRLRSSSSPCIRRRQVSRCRCARKPQRSHVHCPPPFQDPE